MRRLLKGTLWFIVITLLVCLGSVLTLFMLRNAQWVVIRVPLLGTSLSEPLAVAEYETPLAAVMMAACLVGGVLATMAQLPFALRRAVERRRERRFMTDLEEELSDLRSLPVDSPAPMEDPELFGDNDGEGDGGSDEAALFMESLQRDEHEKGEGK